MTRRADKTFADVFAHYVTDFGERIDQALPRMLRAVRQHLGMDVGFIAEFADGQRVFRRVDIADEVPAAVPLPEVGKGHPLDATYCKRIVDGHLPELIPDTSAEPALAGLEPTTEALNIGAYIGVPLRLSDGSVYGTMCCYNFAPDYSLNQRDLGILRVLAEAVSDVIETELLSRRRRRQLMQDLSRALGVNGMSVVYQPIMDLDRGAAVGYEALSRFHVPSPMDTEGWFASAARVGRDVELELHAVETALERFADLPPQNYMAINVSAECLTSGGLHGLLDHLPLERVVLEITERSQITYYDQLLASLRDYRSRGLRLAVDDAGAGYASFRHILMLQPDLIKLDKSLVRDIDKHGARRELAAALIQFCEKTGSELIAEGVETPHELAVLRDMGVHLGQGFYLGSPAPIAA